MVELQFTLSGQRQIIVSGREHQTPVGRGALSLIEDFQAHFFPSAQEQYVSLSLAIPVSLFDYAAMHLATSPNMNFGFDRLKEQSFRSYDFEYDTRSMALVKQLITDFKNDNRSPLMMEASALELLNMHMNQLFFLTPRPNGFSKGEISFGVISRIVLHFAPLFIILLLSLTQMVPLWHIATIFQPDVVPWLKIMTVLMALKGSMEIIRLKLLKISMWRR
ncbi:hypothetical protein PAEVO_05320 [Paenibacillus sp. GM2FR]|nr:hypothetical protein PAEVO_05320 [Paenibacillus sp. GM2FR]